MNREQELNKRFPLEDGTTYIQSLDKSNETANFTKWMHENDTPENAEKYFHYSNEDMFNEYLNELKGAGVGGESIKENFIDSSPNSLDSNKSDEQSKSASVDSSIDWMYNWIKKHKNR